MNDFNERVESKLDDLTEGIKNLSVELTKLTSKLENLERKYYLLETLPLEVKDLKYEQILMRKDIESSMKKFSEGLDYVNSSFSSLKKDVEEKLNKITKDMSSISWFISFSNFVSQRFFYILSVIIIAMILDYIIKNDIIRLIK